MKVTDTGPIKPLAGGATEPARAGSPYPRAASDKVSTRETAQVAAAAAQAGQAAGATRAARLQAIEAVVRQGAYRPDPQRIARQILDDAELAARLQAIFDR